MLAARDEDTGEYLDDLQIADEILEIHMERSKSMPMAIGLSAKEIQKYSVQRAIRASTSRN